MMNAEPVAEAETGTGMRQRAYKTELDPNQAQREAFLRHAGSSRFIYNWALNQCKAAREAGEKKPSPMDLNKRLTVLKREEFPWLDEVGISSLQNAIRHLDSAYSHFFRRVKQGGPPGFPRYKSRKRGIGSFKMNGSIHVFEKHIQLPRIGKVRLKERGYLPLDGVRITSATVSEKAGRWFVAIQVEEKAPTYPAPTVGGIAAVHLGVRKLATVTTDGTHFETFENPRVLDKRLRKLQREQRKLSRKQAGSANREKQRQRVARVHARIANTRQTALHQMTTAIAKRYDHLVLGQFAVSEMVRGSTKGRQFARRILDAGMGEANRQLTYKAAWRGLEVTLSGEAFPVTRLCSVCGHVGNEQKTTTFRCAACAHECDREENAARNLLNLVLAGKSPDRINASGGDVRLGLAEQSPVKEESTEAWDMAGHAEGKAAS